MKKEWTLYNEIELVEPKFGKMPDGAKDKWIEDLPQEEYDRIYLSFLKKVGLGACSFRNTEHNARYLDYENIKTVFDMSKALFEQQKKLRAEGGWVCKSQDQFKSFDTPYLGGEWCTWVREDGTIRFASIYSGMSHFRDLVWGMFYDFIREKIPHEISYDFIPDLMNPGLSKMVTNVDAGGKEKELKIIEQMHIDFCMKGEEELILAVFNEFDTQGKVYVTEDDQMDHKSDHIIFMDLDACKKVSLDQIEQDVNSLASPEEELEAITQEISKRMLEVWQGFTDGVL